MKVKSVIHADHKCTGTPSIRKDEPIEIVKHYQYLPV